MTHIVGIAGSLRRASYNLGLLNAARELMPDAAILSVHTIAGIPLYDADVEAADGLPPAVTALKDIIVESDGVVLATPEYNNGVPGVFKNAIDWLSRPPKDIARVFRGRPFALIGASPGGFGTILSQNGWLPVLRTLGTRTWFGGRMLVSGAGQMFDQDGRLTDEQTRERLRAFMADFVAFAEADGKAG